MLAGQVGRVDFGHLAIVLGRVALRSLPMRVVELTAKLGERLGVPGLVFGKVERFH